MTSGQTFRSAAVSGVPSLSPFSPCRVSLPRPVALKPLSCLSACAALRPLPVRPVAIPPLTEVLEELLEQWEAFDQRRQERGRRGGYNAGWRCWGCRQFVAGPTVTCGACGQLHGGVYHEAYASR